MSNEKKPLDPEVKKEILSEATIESVNLARARMKNTPPLTEREIKDIKAR